MPRGSAPGERRGGRARGAPNKKTQALEEKARALGVDPFEILLRFAANDWAGLGYEHEYMTKIGKGGEPVELPVIEPELRAKCASDACQYLHPKRKAIEVSTDPNESERRVFVVKWADEDEQGHDSNAKANATAKKNQ